MKFLTKQIDAALQLFFDFGLKEQEVKPVEIPAYRENPKTDNDRLMNLQYQHYNGDKGALGLMYLQLRRIAVDMIQKERREKGFFMDKFDIHEKASDAAVLVFEQYQKNHIVIRKSVTAYLYLQVRKVLYTETKGQKFERYCCKYGIDFCITSTARMAEIKRNFEKDKDRAMKIK